MRLMLHSAAHISGFPLAKELVTTWKQNRPAIVRLAMVERQHRFCLSDLACDLMDTPSTYEWIRMTEDATKCLVRAVVIR